MKDAQIRLKLDFGTRLRVARARNRVPLKTLAKACDVTPAGVQAWEVGRSLPSSGRLQIIADLLDVSIEWLFDTEPLDFRSTARAPQGKHAKYWIREALAYLKEEGRA